MVKHMHLLVCYSEKLKTYFHMENTHKWMLCLSDWPTQGLVKKSDGRKTGLG